MTPRDLLQRRSTTSHGSTTWIDSVLTRAMKRGMYHVTLLISTMLHTNTLCPTSPHRVHVHKLNIP